MGERGATKFRRRERKLFVGDDFNHYTGKISVNKFYEVRSLMVVVLSLNVA
jgi:hypothetical protein